MNLKKLKQQIFATIDASQDEALLQDVMDLLLRNSNNSVRANTNDKALTLSCMAISEKSLSEAWDKEDDEYWNSF